MMEYKGYIAKVELDAEAGLLHGEVVGIRDVVTFQGATVQEIQRAFRASVDDYLAFCKERGEEPNQPCSGRFVVRVDPKLHRSASILAKAMDMSLNAFVADAVAGEVERRTRKLKSGTIKRP